MWTSIFFSLLVCTYWAWTQSFCLGIWYLSSQKKLSTLNVPFHTEKWTQEAVESQSQILLLKILGMFGVAGTRIELELFMYVIHESETPMTLKPILYSDEQPSKLKKSFLSSQETGTDSQIRLNFDYDMFFIISFKSYPCFLTFSEWKIQSLSDISISQNFNLIPRVCVNYNSLKTCF